MIPLLILGLVTKYPQSNGYELLALMEKNHYQYIVSFTKGSFYYHLQQLVEKGYLNSFSEEESAREARHYQITTEGHDEFKRLMIKLGGKTEYVNLAFYGAMLFADDYPPTDFQALIQTQIKETQKKILALEKTLAAEITLDPHFKKMLENSRAHHLVNLEWFQQLLTPSKK